MGYEVSIDATHFSKAMVAPVEIMVACFAPLILVMVILMVAFLSLL